VLRVLVARAAGQPLEVLFRTRTFEPLGMKETASECPPGKPTGCRELSPRHRLSFDRSDARPRLDRLASSPTGTGISVSKLTG